MGAPELYLKNRLPLAGESMEFMFRSGDGLVVDRVSREGLSPGDVAVFVGKDEASPVLAHRVWLKRRVNGRDHYLTKGDFHLVPDGFVADSGLIGRVRGFERDGHRYDLPSGPVGRALGLLCAAAAVGGVVLYRLFQFLGWLGGCSCRWGLKLSVTAGYPAPWALPPFMRIAARRAQAFCETVHFRWVRRAFRLCLGAPATRCPGPAEIRSETDATIAGGEITRDTVWSGEVRLFGDVVVLPGVSLRVRPGTRVVFPAKKRFHHGVSRLVRGEVRYLSDPNISQVTVYGTLLIQGDRTSPVVLEGGGVTVLGGERHEIRFAEFRRSGLGLRVFEEAEVDVRGSSFSGSLDSAVSVWGLGRVAMRDCRIEEGAAGVRAGEGAKIDILDSEFSETSSAVLATGQAIAVVARCRLKGGGHSEGVRLENEAQGFLRHCRFEGYASAFFASGRSRIRAAWCRFHARVLISERASAALARCVVSRSPDHALWLREDAYAALRRCLLLQSRDNGILLENRSLLEMTGCSVSGNRTGAHVAHEGALRATDTRFRFNAEFDIAASSGTHALYGCRFAGSRSAMVLSGTARVFSEKCSFKDVRDYPLLCRGASRLNLEDCDIEGGAGGAHLIDHAGVELRCARIRGGREHGLRIAGRARVCVTGSDIRSGQSAVDLSGRARLRLLRGRLWGSRCGLSAAGQAAIVAEGTEFSHNTQENLSLSGGAHSFNGVTVDNSQVGVALQGDAQIDFSRGKLSAHKRALTLTGRSSVRAANTVISHNFIGAWVQEAGRGEFRNCRFGHNGEIAVRAGQSGDVDIRFSKFISNTMGVLLEDSSAAFISSTMFQSNLTGVKVDGQSRAELLDCRLRNSEIDAIWLSPRAHADVSGGVIGTSRIGIHRNVSASLRHSRIRFEDNEEGDIRTWPEEDGL